MIFLMGFQSILMGLIAELLVRTYHESQDKKTYTVRRAVKSAQSSVWRKRATATPIAASVNSPSAVAS